MCIYIYRIFDIIIKATVRCKREMKCASFCWAHHHCENKRPKALRIDIQQSRTNCQCCRCVWNAKIESREKKNEKNKTHTTTLRSAPNDINMLRNERLALVMSARARLRKHIEAFCVSHSQPCTTIPHRDCDDQLTAAQVQFDSFSVSFKFIYKLLWSYGKGFS